MNGWLYAKGQTLLQLKVKTRKVQQKGHSGQLYEKDAIANFVDGGRFMKLAFTEVGLQGRQGQDKVACMQCEGLFPIPASIRNCLNLMTFEPQKRFLFLIFILFFTLFCSTSLPLASTSQVLSLQWDNRRHLVLIPWQPYYNFQSETPFLCRISPTPGSIVKHPII